MNLCGSLSVFNGRFWLTSLCATWDRVGLRVHVCVCVCVWGLIVGQHAAGAACADSNVKVFNNAEVLTGLFIRVKLK